MLVATALVAAAFGVYGTFSDAPYPNDTILVGAFIVLVCVSTTAGIFGPTSMRWVFVSGSLFGTMYFIFVLHGGFGVNSDLDSARLEKNAKLGFALFGISLLASKLLQLVGRPTPQKQATRIDDEIG